MATEQELKVAAEAWDQARSGGVARARAAHSAGADATYTAQPGDTIASIAAAIYGPDAPDRAADLFAVNAGGIGSDPGELAAGTVLTIPYA